MPAFAATTLSDWMNTKRCCSCGFDGPEAERSIDRAYRCPRCDDDWYTRPPRSYAELEGFHRVGEAAKAAPVAPPARASRTTWVLIAGSLVLGCVGMASLVAAVAMSVLPSLG